MTFCPNIFSYYSKSTVEYNFHFFTKNHKSCLQLCIFFLQPKKKPIWTSVFKTLRGLLQGFFPQSLVFRSDKYIIFHIYQKELVMQQNIFSGHFLSITILYFSQRSMLPNLYLFCTLCMGQNYIFFRANPQTEKNVPPFEILIACTFAVAAFDYWGSIVNTCLTS